jgi:hypothetical protein
MHYPFSVIALRRDQRTEGRETRKASTPTGPGRDAIAKSVMVYTSVPSDYCDTDVGGIVQQAPSDVNSLDKERHGLFRGEKQTASFPGIGQSPYATRLLAFAILLRLCYAEWS